MKNIILLTILFATLNGFGRTQPNAVDVENLFKDHIYNEIEDGIDGRFYIQSINPVTEARLIKTKTEGEKEYFYFYEDFSYGVFDYDFGDPVDEDITYCTVTIVIDESDITSNKDLTCSIDGYKIFSDEDDF